MEEGGDAHSASATATPIRRSRSRISNNRQPIRDRLAVAVARDDKGVLVQGLAG